MNGYNPQNPPYNPGMGQAPAMDPGYQQQMQQQQAGQQGVVYQQNGQVYYPNPFCQPGSNQPAIVQSPLPPMVPAGMSVQGHPYIPPSQMPRLGDGQVLQNEWYDHLLYGFGQIIRAREEIFSSGGPTGRTGNPDLSSFTLPGILANDTQFEIAAFWAHTYFTDPALDFDDQPVVPPIGAPSASQLYDLFNTFTRFSVIQQKAEKSVIQLHRIPAGGGITGYDQNAGAIVKNQGVAGSYDVYRFDKKCRYLLPPGKQLTCLLTWMTSLPGGAIWPAGYNPLDQFNRSTTALKVARFGAVGIEVRDAVQG